MAARRRRVRPKDGGTPRQQAAFDRANGEMNSQSQRSSVARYRKRVRKAAGKKAAATRARNRMAGGAAAAGGGGGPERTAGGQILRRFTFTRVGGRKRTH